MRQINCKVNSIDTSGFNSNLEKKIYYTSGLIKKLDYNAKGTEIENKISSISDLATNAALTTVKNEIPNISSSVKKKKKKSECNIKISKIELVKLRKNLVIMIMRNKLVLQNLII